MSESPEHSETSPETSASATLDTAAMAVTERAAETCEVACQSWNAATLFASRFVYTTCYTVSYGIVFPSVLLARAVPRENPAVQGLIDGAQAARERVASLRDGTGAAVVTPV